MGTPPVTSAAAAAPRAPEVALRPVITVTPGQVLAARVIEATGGRLELAIAGGRVTAASDLPLAPGQTVRLEVTRADDERIVLRLLPGAGGAADGGAASGRSAVMSAPPGLTGGLPTTAARALDAALAGLLGGSVEALGDDVRAGLAARAAAAEVRTPAQAAAFVRLAAAGLPPAPVLVAGLADLAEGPPLGRALAALAPAPASVPAGTAPPTVPVPGVPVPVEGDPPPAGPARTHAPPAAPAAPAAAAPGPFVPVAAGPAAALAALLTHVAQEAVAGDGERLQRAHALQALTVAG
ncbi:MAG TPA: hypothetical protein VNT51_03405, partial [Miltoncostaeaceae bacterium]|nr:hypothetical protein [Miltoncostaeaceae bacterium]